MLTPFGQRPRRGRSPVEHRGTFVRHSIRSSVRSSPPGPLRPEICPLRPKICHLRPEICPLRPEICPLRPEICPLKLKSTLSGLRRQISDLRGPGGGLTNERTDEQKSHCVQQDFVPFGAAAQKEEEE